MNSYRIVGDREVVGKKPGEVVSESDLDGVNIAALIGGGHLQPINPKAAKAEPPQE